MLERLNALDPVACLTALGGQRTGVSTVRWSIPVMKCTGLASIPVSDASKQVPTVVRAGA